MGWTSGKSIDLMAIIMVASIQVVLNSQTRPAVQNVTRSPYWDKPLAVPPAPDYFESKVPASIAQWLNEWQNTQIGGKSASESQIAQLRTLFEHEPVTAMRMAQIASMVATLDGTDKALPIVSLTLDRAEEELKHIQPHDPLGKPLLEAMWLLHPGLWNRQHYVQDQRLLELVRPWEVRGSGHAQWATYIYAECLYLQKKYEQAYAALLDVQIERDRAFEPSDGLNRPLDWELGTLLYTNGKFEEAIAHLTVVSNAPQTPEGQLAMKSLIHALAMAGKIEEAEAAFDACARAHLFTSSGEAIVFLSDIESAKRRAASVP